MPHSQASDADTSPTAGEPTPPETSPDQTPDGDSRPTPRKQAKSSLPSRRTSGTAKTPPKQPQSSPSSGLLQDEEVPETSAKPSGAADWAVLTVESERRRLDLDAGAWVRFALYAVLIVLGASLAGYVVGNLGGTVRAARSEVLYQLAAEQPSGNLRQDRQLSTQLVAIRSREVLDPVAKKFGLTREALSDKLHVSVLEDSEVIGLEVDDRSPSRARKLVDAITSEYLVHVPRNEATAARQYLEGQAAAVDQRLQQLGADLARLPSTASASAQQTQMTAEMQSLFTQRAQLDSRLQDATVDELRQPQLKQITKGYVAPDPISPKPWRGAATGALVGLVIAAVAIAVVVRRRIAPRP
jgi:capsular polysaccharide biosynthesis protein